MALISDAGTPLVSDPGYLLVRACLEADIPVEVLPGAAEISLTDAALTGLGLPGAGPAGRAKTTLGTHHRMAAAPGPLRAVCRLEHVIDSLTGARPLRQWLAALTDGVAMLTRINDSDAWQTSQMQREFAEALAQAGSRADTALWLPDIGALLDGHLAGRPTRANFRTGTLTVCTMVPMRSVPHRVVCLVGLDDGVFPRLGIVDGDDVLARNPMTGERDIRSEDRQLLLDAIGAATEKLVVTYTLKGKTETFTQAWKGDPSFGK